MRALLCALALPALISTLVPAAQAQRTPLALPGLHVPGNGLPYAVDTFEGKPALVPIHRSAVEINNHKGANLAGGLAGSFLYKPKLSIELAGLHARTVLHGGTPAIFLHLAPEDPDGGGASSNSVSSTWALTRATLSKDHRVFAKVQFTQITQNAKRADGIVETRAEVLPDGWLKLTPTAPLAPGEYAVQPIPRQQNAFSTVVYDFMVDPAAPLAADAVKPDASDTDQ